MAIILPAAPKNFYDPSLITLKDDLDRVNGFTKGQIALITALPADIEAAWAELGVGGDTLNGLNRGTAVIGHAPISVITGPVTGPEEAPGETGYKLQFDEVVDVPVYIDGSGLSTAVVIGMALVVGVDAYAAGTDNHLKYIMKVNNVTLTDDSLVTIPGVEIIINYSEAAAVVI